MSFILTQRNFIGQYQRVYDSMKFITAQYVAISNLVSLIKDLLPMLILKTPCPC